MLIARVESIGQTARRNPDLNGSTIVLVREEGETGTVHAVVDPLRVAVGDLVIVARQDAARLALGADGANLPIDAAIIAVLESATPTT